MIIGHGGGEARENLVENLGFASDPFQKGFHHGFLC
jgi:hypothetical protein